MKKQRQNAFPKSIIILTILAGGVLAWAEWSNYQTRAQLLPAVEKSARLTRLDAALRYSEIRHLPLPYQNSADFQARYKNNDAEFEALFSELRKLMPASIEVFLRLKKTRRTLFHLQLEAAEHFSTGRTGAGFTLLDGEVYQDARNTYERLLRQIRGLLAQHQVELKLAATNSGSVTAFLRPAAGLALLLLIIPVVRRYAAYNQVFDVTRQELKQVREAYNVSLKQHLEIEKELRRSLTLQKAILDSANLTIIVTDLNGVIQIFNNAAERLLGYSAAEVVGLHTPEILHDGEELARRAAALREELDENIQPGFETLVAKARLGMVDENEWQYVCKNGRCFPVLLSVTALCDESYKVMGYLEIGTDISEAKKVEQMKAEFISTISHELRSPLTSIRGSLGLLRGGVIGEMPDDAKPLLDIADKNSGRLLRLINDILDIEKISAGKMRFDIAPYPLDKLMEHCIQANQGYAEQFAICLRFDNHAPDAVANVDKDRLEQVLTNLLSNACKFSPQGGEVLLSLERCHGGWLEMAVTDKGPGIPEAFHGRIFQKFAQADSSDTRRKGGTGLGLSISRAIVEKLGGRIDFISEEGKGSRFYIQLRDASLDSAKDGKVLTQVKQDEPPRILICAGAQYTEALLAYLLKQAEYTVDTAVSAEEAYTFLHSNRYAVLAVEALFDGGDSLVFLRRLRRESCFAHLPALVVSAKVQKKQQEVGGRMVEFLDWLPRPLDRELLIRALQAASESRAHSGRTQILHVENDPRIQHIVAAVLQGQADLVSTTGLAEARRYLARRPFDLVLLSSALPDGAGLSLLADLYKQRNAPMVLFSAQEVPEESAKAFKIAWLKTQLNGEDSLADIFNALE